MTSPFSKNFSIIPAGLLVFIIAVIAVLVACGSNNTVTDEYGNVNNSTALDSANNPSDAVNKPRPIIVFLGDSLTEGYKVAKEDNYPSRVAELLAKAGMSVQVVNGGLSGETSSGGLDRLEWFLNLQPQALFVALGANDGLRGLALEDTYKNLAKIITTAQARGVQVLLAGQMIPPNYGKPYTGQFKDMYPHLAREYNIPLLPFLLDGVAGVNNLNLDDGIHPNSDGYVIISKNVAKFIRANFKPENIN